MILSLVRYILIAAGRERFFASLGAIALVVLSLAFFFGASAVTEQNEFAVTVAAFGLRLFGVVAVVLFTAGHIRRLFESRDIEYLLSRPVGRVSLVLAFALGFCVLALFTAALLGGTLALLSITSLHPGLFLWWASLGVEFVIMALVSLFFALILNSAAACIIAAFGFYLLARLIGDILGILHNDGAEGGMIVLAKVMEAISIFIPRLDLMAQSAWLVHEVPAGIGLGFILMQGAVFAAMVVAAACVDLHRRQF